jgi:hypothetical protein
MRSQYELIGRQAERICDLEERLVQALALLRALKEGTIALDRLEVADDRISVRALDAGEPGNGVVHEPAPPVPA